MGEKENVRNRKKVTEKAAERQRKSRGEESCRVGGREAAGRAKTEERKDREAERWTPDRPEAG